MEILTALLVGFFFSFIGSIPPGSINLSVLQLAVQGNVAAAFRFIFASAGIEFIYAYIAIRFQILITSSPFVIQNFHIISALVMVLLGIINLFSPKNPGKLAKKLANSGFRKGMIISILNPLAIPFWIGITAYLQSNEWIVINNSTIFPYITGISLGTFALLTVIAMLSSKVAPYLQNPSLIKKIPGFVLLALGLYAFYKFLAG